MQIREYLSQVFGALFVELEHETLGLAERHRERLCEAAVVLQDALRSEVCMFVMHVCLYSCLSAGAYARKIGVLASE